MSNLRKLPALFVSTLATSQTKLKPKVAKELTKPVLSTAFKGGFGIFPPTKNKIILYSVATSVQIDKIKYLDL